MIILSLPFDDFGAQGWEITVENTGGSTGGTYTVYAICLYITP